MPITQQTRSKKQPSASDGIFLSLEPSKVWLTDKTSFRGLAPAGQAVGVGEVVFNTGMTGYVETLTDPSYADQILVFTYPLIGNYGVMDASTWESAKIHLKGVVMSELCQGWSHEGAVESLFAWLQAQGVPFITDVDTRSLTKYLRTRGTMMGAISPSWQADFATLTAKTPQVSISRPEIYNPKHTKTLIVVDCGMKDNILRSLMQLPLRIKRVPMDYDYTAEDYDGVFISNGPGDPEDYTQTIAITKKALAKGKPVFGICLGNQLMGLAAGAKTYKLPFGHRGHNQPCIDLADQKCYITSQNHGYAIDEKSLPAGWRVSYRNLNDQSIEGIAHQDKPFFAVQFHPEASPGPTDSAWLFERFYSLL